MHVTFLMQDTGTLYGAERATLDLASGLAHTGQMNVSVTLIHESRLETSNSHLEQAFRDAGISCHSLSTRRPFSWSLVRAIRDRVQAQHIDCVHAVGYKAAVHGGLAVRCGRLRPWVSTVHGWLERPHPKERFYGWLETQMLKRAQRVVVLSNYYRNELAGRGLSPQRLRLIPSGLQLGSLCVKTEDKPFSSTGRPPTIGILGRLSLEKNHAMFLRVARRLLDDGKDAQFLIAGDGPERADIERQIRQLELGSCVEFAGVMDRADFFRRADLLVTCSRIENLPYSILEAMAWSRPVVATCVGGIPDLIEPGKNGLLVEDGDVVAMVRALGRLFADVPLAQAMGAAGRQRLEERFTLERSVETHLRMYHELSYC